MGIFKKVEDWTSSHNPKWLALLRVALGATLLLRGVSFLNDLPNFEKLLDLNNLGDYKNILMHAVPWIHIVGGFLIIMGLFTRFFAFIQMPILLGALIFITAKRGFFNAETDLSLSIIILVLLLVFVIEGSGSLSLSQYFKEADEEEAEA